MFRPVVVRRRPLLRAAAIGGTYAAGRAMGRRAEQQQQDQYAAGQQAQAQAQADQSGQVPGQRESAEASPSVMDQLNQLTALHEKGALSDDEFATAKAKILGS